MSKTLAISTPKTAQQLFKRNHHFLQKNWEMSENFNQNIKTFLLFSVFT
jgi:hypothetical protein